MSDPTVLELWPPDMPPGHGGFRPTLTAFPPRGAGTPAAGTGARRAGAMIVCPGGGYREHAGEAERAAATWLSELGIAAYVLRYRLFPSLFPAPMDDLQRAIRLVRHKADEWNVDRDRVGIMGFSAGGHLASTAATRFDDGDPLSGDAVERWSSRPDLLVLGYPVITFGPHRHDGSMLALLGDHPTPELRDLLSSEKHVSALTPPTFLWHTAADQTVPVCNSLLFAEALQRHGRPFELHVYEAGPHGMGLAEADGHVGSWSRLCAQWLDAHGWLQASDPDDHARG
ncbi:MAG: alpha/beta hydrolase [Acidimicrobiales bacterium]